jgi:hypothetical protein
MEKEVNQTITKDSEKKSKKPLILLFIILITLLLIGVIYFYINNNHKSPDNKVPTITYQKLDNNITISCTNSKQESTAIYYQGEDIYCSLSYDLSNDFKGKVSKITGTFTFDSELELIETNNISSDWKEISSGQTFNLSSNDALASDEKFYTVKFRIKGTTEKEIISLGLKDIHLETNDNKHYQLNNSQTELMIAIKNNYRYELDRTNKEFIFYKSSPDGYKEINKYTCKTNCFEYAAQSFAYIDLNVGRMFIIDNNNTEAILYDFTRGVLATYEIPVYSLSDESYNIIYFVAKLKDGKYGIVDTSANIIRPFVSDGFVSSPVKAIYSDTYSIKNNLIVEKKNNKYGLTNINRVNTVLDYKYDSIRLLNDKYYKVKVGDNWYLYNMSNNEQALKEKYQEIFMPTPEILIVKISDYLYIKNESGQNLIEDKIYAPMAYDENACCGSSSGIYVILNYEDNNIVNIITYTDSVVEKSNTIKYVYNIKENKLTKKDSTN